MEPAAGQTDMRFVRTGVALVPLVLLGIATATMCRNGLAQDRPIATVAREVGFYAKENITVELTGPDLIRTLGLFLTTDAEPKKSIDVRILRIPSVCEAHPATPTFFPDHWRQAKGQVRGMAISLTNDGRYLLGITDIDSASLKMVDGSLFGHWYYCDLEVPYAFTFLTDASQNHFVLRDMREPYLAWSKRPSD